MADEKISAMPAATACANADVVPLVQGGVNKKVSRQILLLGNAGEDIEVKASAGQKVQLVDSTGATLIEINAGGKILLLQPSSSVVVTYNPFAPGEWPTHVPNNMAGALDQLAHAIFVISLGTLP